MTTPAAAANSSPSLVRSIGPFQLALYALGSMLGSGIYGLIGKAAGQAGTAVWLSFLVALVAALLTALSYASLGSRYPRAGGAAYATQRAFRLPILSFTIGLALVCSGLTSVATQSKIFSANLAALFGLEALPPSAIALGFVLILTAIVFRGIRESMWVNVLCTLIEASGLLIVIAAGMSYWGSVSYFDVPAEKADVALAIVVVQASVLSFFAFIGFEDAINVAEECKDPQRTIPIGLMAATAAAAVLYIAVAVTAVSVVPPAELAAAPSPLTEVMKRSAPGFPGWVMTAIALFSVANTALVNYITGSRLIYGMSNQGLLHDKLGEVHEQRRTPHYAILALLTLAACRAEAPAPWSDAWLAREADRYL
ncbi:MAG: APC family permease, partial [Hyphomicrobium sp.]